MLSYLSSFLPSSSRKRLRVEVDDDDNEDEEEEGKDAIAKDGRKIAKQLSTKTRNALKQSLEISLARVHEACFYFYAMGANEEGENQLKVLLRNVIEQAAVDTSCWVFLSQFQVLSSDTARVIHLSDSEIEVEYLAMANDAKANHTCFRLRFCVRLASVGDIKMTTEVEVDWKPSDEVASIARGLSPSSRLIYQIASGLLKKKRKTPSLAPKTFQYSVETVMEKLNMAPCDSARVTAITSLAFHAADASKVEILPPAPIKFIRGSLKKMQTNFHTFTFISLFSGCGVSARGLSDAGGLCVLFAEKDSYRREILRKNNPHLEAWQFVEKVEDINQDLIDRVVAKYKHVDLIEGGVRCDDVSSKNFKRGEKSFEEVAFPFLLVGKIETMVERAHMKAYEEIMKKTRKSRLQASIPIPTPCVVLIENVTGLAKRVNNRMPYICFLFQMCVRLKMSFAVRTLNAHAAGLDHTRERLFFVATRERRKGEGLKICEQILNFQPTNDCKGECLHNSLLSRGARCFECEDHSRAKREEQETAEETARNSPNLSLFDSHMFLSVNTQGSTALFGLTQTNASGFMLLDRTRVAPPQYLCSRDLCELCGVSRNHFGGNDEDSDEDDDDDDDDSARGKNMAALGESPTANPLRFLGTTFVRSKRTKTKDSNHALSQPDRAWAEKFLDGKTTMQLKYEYGVGFDISDVDIDIDASIDDASIDKILRNHLRRTKEVLTTPMIARCAGKSKGKRMKFCSKSTLRVSEEELSNIRLRAMKPANAENYFKIEYPDRRALGLEMADDVTQLTCLIEKKKREGKVRWLQILFDESNGEEFFAEPFLRLTTKTIFQLGRFISRVTKQRIADLPVPKNCEETFNRNERIFTERVEWNSDDFWKHQHAVHIQKLLRDDDDATSSPNRITAPTLLTPINVKFTGRNE